MTMLDATTAPLGADARAFVLLKSRRRLDLLNPDPQAWTDDDLAAGLSRTMRWGGASKWGHPLSVAQHSLTVLAIREAEGPLTAREGLRELLHDATEFMLGWDCIAPLKAQLGAPFRQLEARLQAAIDARYQLPSWTGEAYAKHKRPIVSPPPPRRSTGIVTFAIFTCQSRAALINRRQENQSLGEFHGGAAPPQNALFLANVTMPPTGFAPSTRQSFHAGHTGPYADEATLGALSTEKISN